MSNKSNRGRKLPNDVLNRGELQALCQSLTNGSLGLRNKALIYVLHRAGLRISEALALRPADILLNDGVVHVTRGKGGAQRIVGIDSESVEVIARWCDRRKSLGIDGRVALFCTIKNPRPIRQNAAREMLNRLRQKAGVGKRCNPHSLRTTFAAVAARQIPCLSQIQSALGHKSLATTAIYLQSLGGQGAIDAVRGINWG